MPAGCLRASGDSLLPQPLAELGVGRGAGVKGGQWPGQAWSVTLATFAGVNAPLWPVSPFWGPAPCLLLPLPGASGPGSQPPGEPGEPPEEGLHPQVPPRAGDLRRVSSGHLLILLFFFFPWKKVLYKPIN